VSAVQIEVAEHAGACYGVRRALDIARGHIGDDIPTYTLGPLIHNPQVVSQLEEQGIRAVSSPEDVDAPSTLVIRSHGVTPDVIDRARQRGLSVDDATCPHVARAQQAASRIHADGRCCLVVGEAGHPEVEGIVGHAGDAAIVVGSASEIPEDLPHDVGVVVQTTQTHAVLDEVVSALQGRDLDVHVEDTICLATQERQRAATELAGNVDVMVVVGGRNSGNTRRLRDLCRERCERTYHIETARELEPAWFDGCARVGVTAGASTPEEQIREVCDRLAQM
jgi:4-hydroxy-3-methylbut-2-enyl diphosphate reductase